MNALRFANGSVLMMALGLVAMGCAASEDVGDGRATSGGSGGSKTTTGSTSTGSSTSSGSTSAGTTSAGTTSTGTTSTGTTSTGTTTAGSGAGGTTTTTTTTGGGGSGTGTGAGGAGGGGSTGGTCVGMATDTSLDDMEAGLSTIFTKGCRSGSWYTYNDMTTTGMQMPAMGADCKSEAITPARGTSTKAQHTSGSGFTVWGAGLGVNLNSPTAAKGLFDASAYSGVTFWAKGTGTIKFSVPTKATDASGGVCTVCSDHYATTFMLSATWTQVTIKWADLKTSTFGMPAAATFTKDQIYGFQWQVDKTAATFDIWIDDLSFTP